MQGTINEPSQSDMGILAYRALYGWVNVSTGKRVPGLLDEFTAWKGSVTTYFRVMIGFMSIIALHFLGVPTEYAARVVGFLVGWVHS